MTRSGRTKANPIELRLPLLPRMGPRRALLLLTCHAFFRATPRPAYPARMVSGSRLTRTCTDGLNHSAKLVNQGRDGIRRDKFLRFLTASLGLLH